MNFITNHKRGHVEVSYLVMNHIEKLETESEKGQAALAYLRTFFYDRAATVDEVPEAIRPVWPAMVELTEHMQPNITKVFVTDLGMLQEPERPMRNAYADVNLATAPLWKG